MMYNICISAGLILIMEKIPIAVKYGGIWDADYIYINNNAKMVLLSQGMSYIELITKLSKEVFNDNKAELKVSFNTEYKGLRGMMIENDDNLEVLMYLLKNNAQYKNCALIVENDTTSNEDKAETKRKGRDESPKMEER